MPLITTAASASAKGYGFGLESSVDETASVTGLAASALVGNANITTTNSQTASVTGLSVSALVGNANITTTNNQTASVTGLAASGLIGNASVVIPEPVPVSQYWTLISRAQTSTTFFRDVYANLFSFTSSPSPSITAIQQDVFLGVLEVFNPGVINIQTTTSGRVYVSTTFKTGTPNVGSRVFTYDISAGVIGTRTLILQFSYSSGGGSFNFVAVQDLSVTPSRTKLATTYNYLNQNSNNRFAVSVYNLSVDGLTATGVNPINPLAVNTYDQRSIAINPIYTEFIAIGGNLLSNLETGFIWLYKNWGVSLGETIVDYSTVGRTTELQWSHSGEYLFASSLTNDGTRNATVWKLNSVQGTLTLLNSFSITTVGATWTLGDESVLIGSVNEALVRAGDTFTLVTGPVTANFGTQPAFNYNGQYLFAANTQTSTPVKVFEYEGPTLFQTPVINISNAGRLYEANGSFPMFDGLE